MKSIASENNHKGNKLTEDELRERMKTFGGQEKDSFEWSNLSLSSLNGIDILYNLLQFVEEVDFQEEAGTSENLNQRHFQVIVIDRIIQIAKQERYNLAQNTGFTYIYNGKFWEVVDADTLKRFLGEAAEKMGVPTMIARHHEFKEKLLKQFNDAAHLPTPNREQEILINLLNGTLDFGSIGEPDLRSHEPEDFLTHCLPFEYDPTHEAPKFKQFLNEVLPERDKQQVLKEFIGWIFIPTTKLKLEKALLLYGSGSNGKSVFHDIVSALLGDENIGNYSLQSLTDRSGYYRAMLGHKLVNYSSEINTKLETNIFKKLVSGEPVDARLPYGKPFELTEYAKLIFNCNELPTDVEHTKAYFRRFLIIPFEETITEDKQDKELASRIIEHELPGVLNWVIDGLKTIRMQLKFSDCQSSKEALKRFEIESDSVQLYIEEKEIKPGDGERIKLKDLYSDYKEYCRNATMQPVKEIKFNKRLQNAGFEVRKMNDGNNVFYSK